MLSRIAWRNIWRSKLRSIIIIASLTIGIVGAIVMIGYMMGMTNQQINSAIANETSNIQIHNPKFLLSQEIKYLIPNAEEMISKIKNTSGVKAVSLRLKGPAMAASASAGAGITINGVVPDDEFRVSKLHNHIIEGVYLSSKQKLSAVIGKKLSEKLNLGLSDKIIITLTDSSGSITSGAFQIVGIYKTSNDLFDQANVFIKRDDLAHLIGYPSKDGNEIAILLSNNDQTNQILSKLKTTFAQKIKSNEVIIQSWEEIQPLLKSMLEMMNFFSYLFLLIILVALAFAIINTMMMAMMERTREIGMLMALGMNKIKISKMILLETLYLSLLGAVVGLVMSFVVVQYYSVHGLDLSSFASGLNSFGYSSTIYFNVNPEFYFVTAIVVALFALLSGIPAALKALKLQPAEAIRRDE